MRICSSHITIHIEHWDVLKVTPFTLCEIQYPCWFWQLLQLSLGPRFSLSSYFQLHLTLSDGLVNQQKCSQLLSRGMLFSELPRRSTVSLKLGTSYSLNWRAGQIIKANPKEIAWAATLIRRGRKIKYDIRGWRQFHSPHLRNTQHVIRANVRVWWLPYLCGVGLCYHGSSPSVATRLMMVVLCEINFCIV